MTRTFTTFAILLTLGMVTTIAVGFLHLFAEGGSDGPSNQYFFVHFCLGLTTGIGSLFVHCLIFTYFLGTGRWVKEVGLAFQLPDEPWPKLTRELKRGTFPPALFAMLTGIATVAAGAGAQLQAWPAFVHATLAFVTLGVNLWAFGVEYRSLELNARVIQAVLEEVDRIRAAQGLPSNAEALLEDKS